MGGSAGQRTRTAKRSWRRPGNLLTLPRASRKKAQLATHLSISPVRCFVPDDIWTELAAADAAARATTAKKNWIFMDTFLNWLWRYDTTIIRRRSIPAEQNLQIKLLVSVIPVISVMPLADA